MTAAGVAGHPAGNGAGGTASIGSVLDALRTDFPEITISKIRFLESEGLISPARTPSGYRQFAPVDVARLRFVLSAQRDHYLPLKVIRARLEEFDRAPTPDGPTLGGPTPGGESAAAVPAPTAPGPMTAVPMTPAAGPAAPLDHRRGPDVGGRPPGAPHHGVAGGRSPGPVPAVPARTGPDRTGPDHTGPDHTGPDHLGRSTDAGAAVPAPRTRPGTGPVDAIDVPAAPADPDGPVDRAALLALEGVDEALLEGLASHGVPRPDAAGRYEPDAVLIARTAAALALLGVEPRLLRGLRAGADREVGLLTQLVTPVARSRGPEAAQRAETLTRELATLSGRLHALLVAAGLRDVRR